MPVVAAAIVEQVVGRELRAAERTVDVLKIDAALNTAKDRLHEAVEREKRLALRRALRKGGNVRIELRRSMLSPLEQLFRLGREEAVVELARIGVQGIRRRAFVADPYYPELEWLASVLRVGLRDLAVRLDRELVELIVGEGVAQDAILRALYRVLGARDLASRVVSSAFTAGLGQTFERNEDLVEGWEYSAILDGNACENCAVHDGARYPSWAAIQTVLPGGGPNPSCFGGGRCRCRAVPVAA